MFIYILHLIFELSKLFDNISKPNLKSQAYTMLAKGPNTLNLANYAQGQGEQIAYDPNQFIEAIEADSPNLQQMFDNCIKDIQKYDQILAKVAKSVNQISAQEHFITDFYPQFVVNTVYESDQEKKIIAPHDVELGKVMDNLQRGNRILKEQFKGWLFQFAKKTRLTQVLLTENKLLRKYITQKNKDIKTLITSLTNAPNTELLQLQDSLSELKQENSLLLQHLKQIKQKLKDKTIQQKKIVQAYERAEKQKLEIQRKIKQGQDQEEHYAKMVVLLEETVGDLSRREKILGEEKQRLLKIKQEYVGDQQQIEKQIQICKIDRQDLQKHLKQKFKSHQTQKQKLIDQIQDLTQQIKKVNEQKKQIQSDITKNQTKIQQYKVRGEDLDKKISQITKNIQNSEADLNKFKQLQIQQLSNLDLLNFDIEVLKSQIRDCQESEKNNWEKYRRQIKYLEQEKKEQIAKATKQYNDAQWQANQAIYKKKSNIAEKRKQARQLQMQIAQKKAEIEDMKQQLIQIKENQIHYMNLKDRLRDAEKK